MEAYPCSTSGSWFLLRFCIVAHFHILILGAPAENRILELTFLADLASSISLVQKSAKRLIPFQPQPSAKKSSKNVLFIVVDDLRTNIGAYNSSYAQTPHLDRLAEEGLTFKRSYVQFPFCGPSRNSFMTGRRPDATRAFNFQNHFRERGIGEDWSTLPEYFKNYGYLSLGAGKLFHEDLPFDNDNPRSWSQDRQYLAQAEGEGNLELGCAIAEPADSIAPTFCAVNVSADESDEKRQLPDMKTRFRCIEHLRFARETGKNFFVGCGFVKPHTPWEMPLEFFEQVPADIPLAAWPTPTVGMPDIAWHKPADLKGYTAQDFDTLCPVSLARTYRRAYYSSVAYIDYNIGKVLNELEVLGFKDNTAVIVFGDHGWHLGENNLWGKYSNFELDLRIPTIIRAPWLESSKGMVTNVLMEAVDFYPTLVELAGLPDPVASGELHMGGTSLASVFNNPADTSAKTAAFSQHAKPSVLSPFSFFPIPERAEIGVMGYSVRVDEWRYTAWFNFDGERPITNTSIGSELYSHKGDNGDIDFDGENVNVVNDNPDEASRLHRLLLEHIESNIVLPKHIPAAMAGVYGFGSTGCR